MFSAKKLHAQFRRTPYIVFWLIIFFVTSIVALFIQLLVLPYLFPELHAGHGLLVGGDWVAFHNIAVEIAGKVQTQGWSAWELRPYGHSAAGLAAAIYAISVPEPYMFIPINAALHATAGVTLMRIARYLIDDDFFALCAALPFVIFPSAMAWYTQLHKDGFYFAGAFLFLYGWIIIAHLQSWQLDWRPVLTGLIWIVVGLALMGVVRTYSFQVMQAMGFILAMCLSILFVVRGVKKAMPWKRCGIAIVIIFIVPVLLRLAPVDSKLSSKEVKVQSLTTEAILECELIWANQLAANMNMRVNKCWRSTSWLPNSLENKFLWLAVQRESYLHHTEGGSLIDVNVILSSVTDFFAYFPRAVQVGFFAPFPSHWVEQGVSSGGGIMRKVAGFEMMGVYIAILFLPYALWSWRGKVELWLPVIFGTIMLMIYTYSTPNLGTFYRQSYGFRMLLVVIGFAGCLNIVRYFKSRQIEK